MREQLEQYIALLFAGAQDCEDIQQEILQNTLDRYDDLIAQGKRPEAAYRLAISSIGDINEILNKPAYGSIAQSKAQSPMPQQKVKKYLPFVIAGIVCICLLAILLEVLDELPRGSRYGRHNTVEATQLTTPIVDLSETVTLGKMAVIHSSPSDDAGVNDELGAGTQVTIQRRETINNKLWAYINSPVQGWMMLEDHSPTVPYTQEATNSEAEDVFFPEKVTVYSNPSTKSNGIEDLDAGTEIKITRRELIDGKEWGYTTHPIQGWILMESQETPTVTVTEPVNPVTYTQPAEQEVFGSSMLAEAISSISIDWVSGNISILAGEGDRIVIEETEGDYPLIWKTKGTQLSIDFCEESIMRGFRLGGAKAKDLTVTVPRDWLCRDLEIDAASADIVIQDLNTQKVEIDAANGRTEFINCTVGSLEMDAASGDVFFVGNLDTLEFDATSANFIATLSNKPKRIDIETASGGLDLTIPGDTGFTVRMEGIKNIFSAQDFLIKKQNGAYIHGDGSCRIEMESVSGGIQINKAN